MDRIIRTATLADLDAVAAGGGSVLPGGGGRDTGRTR